MAGPRKSHTEHFADRGCQWAGTASGDHGSVRANNGTVTVTDHPSLAYWGYAMALTTLGIVFVVGATLGVRFEVPILFPAICLAVVSTAVVGIAHGDSVGAVMLTTALVATAVQIGYLFGVVTREVTASLGVPAGADPLRLPTVLHR
jgi:hypothetical protein